MRNTSRQATREDKQTPLGCLAVDKFCSLAFGKLYTAKIPITAADLLNDRVLPFYEEEDVSVNAVLTDRGTEFKGRLDRHAYELFLQLNDIEHRLCKVATPRTNGFVERFNRTILDEFFREAFRKKFYAKASRSCRPTWTRGFITTTTSGRTAATATWEDGHTRPSPRARN